MKILLVDDDTDLGKIIVSRLSRRGMVVVLAASLVDAYRNFDAVAGDFGAILCDYHLGSETGLSFFDYVAAKGFVGRFVVMSGDDCPSPRLSELCLSGKCYHVLKPFDLESLVSVIKG